MDVAVTVQNLLSLIQAAPEFRDDIVKQTFDLLGLGQPKKNQMPPQPQMPPGGAGAPPTLPPGGTQTPQPGGAGMGVPLAGRMQQQALTRGATIQ
jgi:hypothetical protein